MTDWIKVSERLPDIGIPILAVWREDQKVMVGVAERLPDEMAGRRFKNVPWFHTSTAVWCGPESLVYWMPLPPPPEEK